MSWHAFASASEAGGPCAARQSGPATTAKVAARIAAIAVCWSRIVVSAIFRVGFPALRKYIRASRPGRRNGGGGAPRTAGGTPTLPNASSNWDFQSKVSRAMGDNDGRQRLAMLAVFGLGEMRDRRSSSPMLIRLG